MKIRRSHNLGAAEARVRADRVADDLREQFSLRSEWRGDAMLVSGTGVNGRLLVDDTHFELEIRLGFALKLMEGPIRSAIEKAIDEELA
ncbi:MAG: polyhydroxyalkanoic acid system family protein [Gammaproteobacteria bacterium]|nr:polyhydroxyalkanoic acid system family protein [Gammaproteobacteria bacterium]NNF49600.1 polyhydroxyalkanoic acid system protein [Woeseiaceae bacterium]MBT8093420.1 polyhydroxyalkanoic acid system family protein [Gammaproteobacteria bacterium]MBT8106214.1 polyhydroxyalkanoic acid system family protein [Gammaproteobacteria bacterium]NNK26228.1 polyhydroxyalkanoic acid system protein [Woeseiaceae bacterium]